jgi:hyperosmotically inducible periplasmic protein
MRLGRQPLPGAQLRAHSVRTVRTVESSTSQGEEMNIITKCAALAAVAAGLAVSGCNVVRGQSSAGQYVDDVAITTKVKTELLESGRVDGLDVNVDSLNGKVTLKGWASSETEAKAAGDIARQVDGVRSVDNQLQVKR